jgi:hypothetical protein
MAAIKIEFHHISVRVSTWVEDHEWEKLTMAEKKSLIEQFVRKHYPRELVYAASVARERGIDHTVRNYHWGEI